MTQSSPVMFTTPKTYAVSWHNHAHATSCRIFHLGGETTRSGDVWPQIGCKSIRAFQKVEYFWWGRFHVVWWISPPPPPPFLYETLTDTVCFILLDDPMHMPIASRVWCEQLRCQGTGVQCARQSSPRSYTMSEPMMTMNW